MKAKIPPPVVFLICGVLMWVTDRLLPTLAFRFPFHTAVFWTLLVVGIVLMVSGIWNIFKHKTTIHPNRESLPKARTLITTGVFRYSRNPIYLGMAIFLLSWWISLMNWTSLAGVVIFVAFITQFQIKPEEEALTSVFGDSYLQYKRRVRRWV